MASAWMLGSPKAWGADAEARVLEVIRDAEGNLQKVRSSFGDPAAREDEDKELAADAALAAAEAKRAAADAEKAAAELSAAEPGGNADALQKMRKRSNEAAAAAQTAKAAAEQKSEASAVRRAETAAQKELNAIAEATFDLRRRIDTAWALLKLNEEARFMAKAEASKKFREIVALLVEHKTNWAAMERIALGRLESPETDTRDAWEDVKARLAKSPELPDLDKLIADLSEKAGIKTFATSSTAEQVTFRNGSHLSYGLTLSLLRFSTSRRADEPARLRNYTPALELLPAEFGFQFTYHSAKPPWRLTTESGGAFQLLSAGGLVLARVDSNDFDRGNVSVAATLGFFDDVIGFGVGVDLYRGIPVQGADGTRGGDVAYTGILSWALSTEGELTPENAFGVLTINLAGLAGAFQGQINQ